MPVRRRLKDEPCEEPDVLRELKIDELLQLPAALDLGRLHVVKVEHGLLEVAWKEMINALQSLCHWFCDPALKFETENLRVVQRSSKNDCVQIS